MSITAKLQKAESERPNEHEAVRRGSKVLKRAWGVCTRLLGDAWPAFQEAQLERALALRARDATSRRGRAAQAEREEARALLTRAVESLASARVAAGAPPSDPLRGVFASSPGELASLSPEVAADWASRLVTSARAQGIDKSLWSPIEAAERALSQALRREQEEERAFDVVEAVLSPLRPVWLAALESLRSKAKAVDAASPPPVNKRRKGVFAALIVGDEEIDGKGLFGLLPSLWRRAIRWSRARPVRAALVAGGAAAAIGAIALHEHHAHARSASSGVYLAR